MSRVTADSDQADCNSPESQPPQRVGIFVGMFNPYGEKWHEKHRFVELFDAAPGTIQSLITPISHRPTATTLIRHVSRMFSGLHLVATSRQER